MSVSSSSTDNLWKEALTAKVPKTKTVKQINILYPEFYNAHTEIDDECWSNVLLDYSQGNFHREFRYVNKKLFYVSKNLSLDVEKIQNEEPDLRSFAERIISFIRETLHKNSAADIERNKHLLQHISETTQKYEPWKKINLSKTKRAKCIRDYVETTYKDESKYLRDELYSQFTNLFEMGLLKTEDVSYNQEIGKITNISGATIYNHEIIITAKLDVIAKPNKTKKVISDGRDFIKDWNKYCTDFENYLSIRVPNVAQLKGSTISSSTRDGSDNDSDSD